MISFDAFVGLHGSTFISLTQLKSEKDMFFHRLNSYIRRKKKRITVNMMFIFVKNKSRTQKALCSRTVEVFPHILIICFLVRGETWLF